MANERNTSTRNGNITKRPSEEFRGRVHKFIFVIRGVQYAILGGCFRNGETGEKKNLSLKIVFTENYESVFALL